MACWIARRIAGVFAIPYSASRSRDTYRCSERMSRTHRVLPACPRRLRLIKQDVAVNDDERVRQSTQREILTILFS
jgi:hypothetical protein